jgi:hypothetical protein
VFPHLQLKFDEKKKVDRKKYTQNILYCTLETTQVINHKVTEKFLHYSIALIGSWKQ